MTPYTVDPRTDLRSGLFWVALGALIVIASWRMDRLEQQGAPIYSAPGLWPGIVGLIIAAMGGLLIWRSLRRAGEAPGSAAEIDPHLVPAGQFALATAMFFAYAVLLVGHGLPYWLGTSAFVTAYVFVFRRAQRAPDVAISLLRELRFALVCGVLTAAAVSFVFESLFFVRLP